VHGFWGSKGLEGLCNALRDGLELSLTRSLRIFRDQQNSLLARVNQCLSQGHADGHITGYAREVRRISA
jgi:hypothetical protein